MPGIRPVFEKGPITFSATTTANGGLIKGGQLVEPDGTTGRIKVATVDSAKVLGVALGDTAPSDMSTADGTDSWGNTVANMTFHPNEVAVAYQGVWLLTNGSGATVAFGDLVACNGSGNVKSLGAGVFGTCVGRCVEPGGIAAGAKGKILLGSVGA